MERKTTRLRRRLENDGPPSVAPLALDALCARLAASLGFEALYLGGGALGYVRAYLEANLTLTEMARAGLDIAAACDLPLVLDGAAGWGDPMHLHRTVAVAEAAGFAAIEVEDQILPKRAHHHVGVEHMVPVELMCAKVREARAARRDPDFAIIARTNAIRASSRDDAVARLEAYREAGADAVMPLARTPEDVRFCGERLAPPIVLLAPPGGPRELGMSLADLGALGVRLVCDTQTVLLAQFHAARAVYRALAREHAAAPPSGETWAGLQEAIHDVVGLERLLAVERDTVERG